MTIRISRQEQRSGLARCDGDAGTAGVHLGVMRGLHRSGILAKRQLIAGVSAGRIAGGTPAAIGTDPAGTLDRFEARLRTGASGARSG